MYPNHLNPDALKEVWRRFAAALRPLHEAGKLGSVLFQYPPWFTPRKDNRAEIEVAPVLLRAAPAPSACGLGNP